MDENEETITRRLNSIIAFLQRECGRIPSFA